MTREELSLQTNDIVAHLLEVYKEVISEQQETIRKLREQVARDQRTIDRLVANRDAKNS